MRELLLGICNNGVFLCLKLDRLILIGCLYFGGQVRRRRGLGKKRRQVCRRRRPLRRRRRGGDLVDPGYDRSGQLTREAGLRMPKVRVVVAAAAALVAVVVHRKEVVGGLHLAPASSSLFRCPSDPCRRIRNASPPLHLRPNRRRPVKDSTDLLHRRITVFFEIPFFPPPSPQWISSSFCCH